MTLAQVTVEGVVGGQAVPVSGTTALAGSTAPGATGVTELGEAQTVAAAAMNPTLAAAAAETTWITGFSIDGLGATAGSVIEATIVGVLGGTKRFKLTIPAGVAVAIARLVVEFARPIPASAVNTAIVLNVPSFGAGNTSAVSEIHGFRKA